MKRGPKANGWGGAFLSLPVSAKGDRLGKYRNPHSFCAALRDLIGKALTPEDLETPWLRNGPAIESRPAHGLPRSPHHLHNLGGSNPAVAKQCFVDLGITR